MHICGFCTTRESTFHHLCRVLCGYDVVWDIGAVNNEVSGHRLYGAPKEDISEAHPRPSRPRLFPELDSAPAFMSIIDHSDDHVRLKGTYSIDIYDSEEPVLPEIGRV